MERTLSTTRFTVLIPSKDADNVDRCVASIQAHGETCRIIVIDDGLSRRREDCEYIQGAKPFGYPQNINRGIRAAATDDVLLLNDDTELVTASGFTKLAEEFQWHEGLGILSPGIQGNICNRNQDVMANPGFRPELRMLAFVAVYICRRLIEEIGLLDERFGEGYGCDDSEYTRRALMAGFQLGVWDKCVVDHSHPERSTFRSKPNWERLYHRNLKLYEKLCSAKTVEAAFSDDGTVDLLYLACNRRAFTEETFNTLVANTDWFLVRRLFVYDDGSIDGTKEFLKKSVKRIETEVLFQETSFGDPIGVMGDFIERSEAPLLAKIDNDAMVPDGWLNDAVAVMRRHEELDLLGLEPGNRVADSEKRGYESVDRIGGLALMRKRAFAESAPQSGQKYCGWWEWQQKAGAKLVKGWVKPGIPIFTLDRLPFEPWMGMSKEYERNSWQRHWWNYDPVDDAALWRWRWPAE